MKIREKKFEKIIKEFEVEQKSKEAQNGMQQRLEACEGAVADIALAVMSDGGINNV